MDSDITTRLSGKTQEEGRSERAPARGVKVSEILALSLVKTLMNEKRERAPANGGDGLGYSYPVFRFDPWGCETGHPGRRQRDKRSGASAGGKGLR